MEIDQIHYGKHYLGLTPAKLPVSKDGGGAGNTPRVNSGKQPVSEKGWGGGSYN